MPSPHPKKEDKDGSHLSSSLWWRIAVEFFLSSKTYRQSPVLWGFRVFSAIFYCHSGDDVLQGVLCPRLTYIKNIDKL